ncbi:unnamed protein product [Lymnaea stagnalis]|uniref:U4/U6.U5 small nuclear ribonucleoprotein 27 kDa protein n=1 Tax=Lymnaea stagnalis TaxID=6523 RepID=A0AAV2GWI1_LYMST
MPRSRSRSPPPKRDRRRSRSRSRDRRHRKPKRSRSRSPRHRVSPPPRHRSRSASPRRRSPTPPPKRIKEVDPGKTEKKAVAVAETAEVDVSKLEGLDEEQVNMMKLMGFATFDTTKGKKVDGNDVSAVNLQRKRRYRQYMNRRGGFNRPLDFVA